MNLIIGTVLALVLLVQAEDPTVQSSTLSDAARVRRIGNPIQASKSGVDVAGATFLLNNINLVEGVVYAFRAYVRADTKVKIQMWRPTNTTSTNETQATTTNVASFKLVFEQEMKSTVKGEQLDLYISTTFQKCFRVESGDRLGLHFEETPGTIAYVFDSSNPVAYGKQINRSTLIGEELSFSTLTFPYIFSVAAYVDTDLSRYPSGDVQVDCPVLLIPENVVAPEEVSTTPAPITGAPGATGPQGPQGDVGHTGATGPVGATGPLGEIGATGVIGGAGFTGATGPMGTSGMQGATGPMGATGEQGEKGDKGDQGIQGPPGPPGKVITDDGQNDLPIPITQEEEEAFLASSTFSLILIVWLIIVTLMIVIIILIFCLTRRREIRRVPSRDSLAKLPALRNIETVENPTTPVEEDTEWMGTLKSTTEISQSVETLNEQEVLSNGKVNDGYTGSNASLAFTAESAQY